MVRTYCPASLAEALRIRKEQPSLILAGGTDLMVKFKSMSGALPRFPLDVLYIGDLAELKGIGRTVQGLRIGAAVKLADLLQAGEVPGCLKKAVRQLGSPAVRNMGTLGGNICNASPAGDTLPVLYGLDAVLELVSSDGIRRAGIAEFITGPGKTDLRPDEILSGIILPRADFSSWDYRKLGARKSNAISKLSVFLTADLTEGEVCDIRIALGAVGPTVVRSRESEIMIMELGRSELPGAMRAVMAAYGQLISPISDVRSTEAYRRDVALGVLKEMIERVVLS